jgi:hypothetical protein
MTDRYQKKAIKKRARWRRVTEKQVHKAFSTEYGYAEHTSPIYMLFDVMKRGSVIIAKGEAYRDADRVPTI